VESAGLRIVGRQSATVTVLAGRQHPDVPATLDDEESARPHLHVGMLTERATIGPLVVPGRTSCLRCHHLHRRDADPAWPLVAVQWEQAMRRIGDLAADPLLARLVADHVALVLRRFADDGVWSNLAWELRLPDGLGRIESRPPHPLCGCLWPT
jgi:hypothetical protein